MSKPKIAIIQFPGSNCETESIHSINQAGMQAIEFLWNEDSQKLEQFDGYFIIGGFSYEDRSRSGVIASKDKLIEKIKEQAKIGKPVLGICNGAQILVESGLVPGLKEHKIGGALAINKRIKNGKLVGTGFYNNITTLKVENTNTAFTNDFQTGDLINIPFAHGEGRFMIPEHIYSQMLENKQIAFKYSTTSGDIVNNFPTNPNGSLDNIAAITNINGNVMAIMPHPERITEEGHKIFVSMRKYIEQNKQNNYSDFKYKYIDITNDLAKLSEYTSTGTQIWTDLIITDNESITVEQSLKNIGIDCKIKKYNHWEIDTNSTQEHLEEKLDVIIKSEELFNPNKENFYLKKPTVNDKINLLMVKYKDDVDGMNMTNILQHITDKQTIKNVSKSTIWSVEGDYQKVLESGILYNPFSQDVYLIK